MLSEKLRQEVVAVRLVLVALDVELCGGSPTLHIDALALWALLWEDRSNGGVSKLELAL